MAEPLTANDDDPEILGFPRAAASVKKDKRTSCVAVKLSSDIIRGEFDDAHQRDHDSASTTTGVETSSDGVVEVEGKIL